MEHIAKKSNTVNSIRKNQTFFNKNNAASFFTPADVQTSLSLPPASITAEKDLMIQKKDGVAEELQLRSESNQAGDGISATPIVQDVVNSAGKPLEAETKNFMETRFDRDFSDVQIHDDLKAHESSSAINALAYTNNNHVVFGEGQYQPNTVYGKRLLAHELTHVVQQNTNSINPVQRSTDKSAKWTPSQIKNIQRQLRKVHLFPAKKGTTGKIDDDTKNGLDTAFGKNKWQDLSYSYVYNNITNYQLNYARAAMDQFISQTALGQKIFDDLNPWYDIYLNLWLSSASLALQQAQVPEDSDKRNFYVALAGNLVWAATSFFEKWNPIVIAMSFGGSIIGSGALAKDAPPTGISEVDSYLTKLRDALGKESITTRRMVGFECAVLNITDIEIQKQHLWSAIYKNLAFNSSDELRENIRQKINGALIQFQQWRQRVRDCASRLNEDDPFGQNLPSEMASNEPTKKRGSKVQAKKVPDIQLQAVLFVSGATDEQIRYCERNHPLKFDFKI